MEQQQQLLEGERATTSRLAGSIQRRSQPVSYNNFESSKPQTTMNGRTVGRTKGTANTAGASQSQLIKDGPGSASASASASAKEVIIRIGGRSSASLSQSNSREQLRSSREQLIPATGGSSRRAGSSHRHLDRDSGADSSGALPTWVACKHLRKAYNYVYVVCRHGHGHRPSLRPQRLISGAGGRGGGQRLHQAVRRHSVHGGVRAVHVRPRQQPEELGRKAGGV